MLLFRHWGIPAGIPPATVVAGSREVAGSRFGYRLGRTLQALISGRGIAFAFALAVCLALPGSASASLTFGADLTQGLGAGCGSDPGEPCSLYTVEKSPGVPETGSPINGVLVSARVKTSGPATNVFVRVLHPNPMMAATFLNVGPETTIGVPTAPAPGVVSEAAGLHHPIGIGDLLGLGYYETNPDMSATTAGSCGFRQHVDGDHPVGTEATYQTTCGLEVMVQGTVEPDADSDGFGDETQDLCPTNAALQTACPATPPVSASGSKCKKGFKLKKVKGKKKCVRKKKRKK
jgi:hypothetical protein